MHKKIIENKKVIALILTSIILFSGYAPFLAQYLNTSNTSETESKNQANPSFLYLNNVTKADYTFDAKGECFIIVEIEGIDFTYFALDGDVYEVSYGLNIFPIKFGDSFESHQIIMDTSNLECFKSFTVEPLTITEGILNTRLDQDSIINFQAGGMISVLTRPSFLYNWLYVELKNANDETTLLKRIYDTAEYPEIDPMFYCLFIERGTYIRYDINLEPGIYKLILRGNGQLEYKILINSDWDKDCLNDVDEMQQSAMYEKFDLVPTIPDIWGFFEKSNEIFLNSSIEEEDSTEGFFSFYVPETCTNNELSINVKSGIFKDFIIDDDYSFLNGEMLISDRNSLPDSATYGEIESGWHSVSYKHIANYTSEIEFLINNDPVKVLTFSELKDTDGDGIKDLQELSNNLNPSKIDTDEDGIPDNLDGSPLAKLELDPQKIYQIVVPTDPNNDTMINIQIKKPENDYSTNGVPRLWQGEFNVSIYPVLRLFGNKYEYSDLEPILINNYWYRVKVKNYDEWYQIISRYFNNGFRALKSYLLLGGTEYEGNINGFAYYFSGGNILVPKSYLDAGNNIVLRSDMNKQKLRSLWGKEVELLLKSDENYNENGTGDSLPKPDPLDYDSETQFIFPQPAAKSIGYSISIPHDHSSKNDGLLDLRFDIIWLVTRIDSNTGQTSLLHYYDFEEPVLVQTITKREVSNVEYILGNPDCFIENQILWTLTQNPKLGTPEEFNVSDDIVGHGNVNFFDLGQCTEIDRINTPLKENETEVLYMTGSYQNYDILNKIRFKSLTNPDFATTHQGDFDVCFSSYSISDLYEDQNYFVGDAEIQGENKILYQIYHYNLSEFSDEQRASIIGMPVAMELCANSKVLKVSNAQGFNVPVDQIPWNDSQLGPKITIQHLIYIERYIQNPGTPLINFEQGVDIYKEFDDNRVQEVEHSNLFFTSQPNMPAESFQTFVDEYWNQINSINNSLSLLYDLVSNASFPQESLEENINQLLDMIDYFKQHSYLELNTYDDFFQFNQILKHDTLDLIGSLSDIETQFSIPFDFSEMFFGLTTNCAEEITKLSEYYYEKLVSKLEVSEKNQIVDGVAISNTKIRTLRIALFCAGAVCVALGVLMVYSGIQEIIRAKAEKGESSNYEYSMRLARAIGTTVAGALLSIESILLIISSLKSVWASVLSKAIVFLGYLALVVSAVFFILDLISFIDTLYSGEAGAADFANIIMSALSLASCAMIVAGGVFLGPGIILGLSVAIACFLVWLIDHLCNNPHITILDDLTTVSFPQSTIENMRRNGGLEVGDFVNLRLAIKNDGKNPFWMQAKFNVFGDEWEGTNQGWKGLWQNGQNDGPWYAPSIKYDESFTSQITGATPDLQFRLNFEADYRKYSFWDDLFGNGWSRKVATRQTIEKSLHMPVLENNVSSFYMNTAEDFSYAALLQEFNTALEEYRYKDAYDLTKESNSRVERNRLITLAEFENIPIYNIDAAYPALEEYYLLIAYSNTQFYKLLYDHYKDGWRALTPNPSFSNDFHANIFGYDFSWVNTSYSAYPLYRGNPIIGLGGYAILIPKTWVHNAEIEFSVVKELLQQGSDLPIKTNIETDLRETTFKANPISGIVYVNFKLLLNGPQEDTQKEVEFEITPPEGFSISPQHHFIGQLCSTINFTFVHDSGLIEFGAYFFAVAVYLGTECIYKETVPMEIKGFSLVEFVNYEAIDPIIPGDFFQAIDVINSGTYEEVINISVEGIPESFIYKGLYPDDPLENIFLLNPGDSRIALMINPPRHYTTSPGLYTYIFTAQDYVYGSFNKTFIATFEVDEFYDMDFRCINPEITIFDHQTGTYTFELTNLGNVPQKFKISYDDIPFADEYLNEDVIYLEPGETQLITLMIIPTSWGEQEFCIKAVSEGNSSTIINKIIINDDDVNPPVITNFEIIDTPIDVTVKFNVLNEIEGDDRGLSNIKIFIDDELILEYIPDPMETSFSFTFNDIYGKWFMENGTHEIRVELIDNDFDVPNDTLNSSILGTFETELKDMYLYVDWQIEVLKNYTDTHLCWLLDKLISHKLYLAQKHLEIAYLLAERGKITCGLFHDAIAKIMIEIAEFRTEIFNKINFISEEDAIYIISSLHTIRNNIVLLIGTTSGKEHGIPLALIEINLLNLNDFIEEEINCCNRKCLTCYIDCATKSLEIAIFKASMDHNLKCALSCAQWKLELAKNKVNCLLNKGKISQELADTILLEIEQAQCDIEVLKNSL